MTKKLQIFLLGAFFITGGLSNAETAPTGKWLRISNDHSWVIYSFNEDGSLNRANNKAPTLQPFGNYQVVDNSIIFVNNPENYTPVGYTIKTMDCNGYHGENLVLSDLNTKAEYGCYVHLD